MLEAYNAVKAEPAVRPVSLMDHSPGQRQFASLAAHRLYYQGMTGMSDSAYEAFAARRRAVATRAHRRGLVVASRDDATAAHAEEAFRDGVHVAEFPTTLEAAEASRAAGIAITLGAV